MISVSEAKDKVRENIKPLPARLMLLQDAAGLVLAEDIYATQDFPPFAQSSMDGYAIRFSDKDGSLQLRGESAAGSSSQISTGPGEATRIFTGAPLPSGSDTVVMQEKVMVQNGIVTITDATLEKGSHVRAAGAEIRQGALAMTAGTLLSPAAVGYLAGIGLREVPVYPLPSVFVVITGPELQAPGSPLGAGQVYESNSFSLHAALRLAGVTKIEIARVEDNLPALAATLRSALAECDIVLITGGVSVGDYDLVPQAAKECGVQTIFHKVAQRPGKPLLFGLQGGKPLFGLPGNPSSVLSCFYQYVLPALHQLSSRPAPASPIQATLAHTVSKVAGLTHFLKGRYEEGKAIPLGAQESFRLSSFAEANCLICLPEGEERFESGAMVEIYPLPGTL